MPGRKGRRRRPLQEVAGIREHRGTWHAETWIFHLSLPRARKAYQCDYCNESIDKGQQHVCYVTANVEGPGMETWRLHGECYLSNGSMFCGEPRPPWRWPEETK